MRSYLETIERILGPEGEQQMDRTGVGTRSIFGAELRFPLSAGFPLVTTKKVALGAVIHELLWIIRGDTNVKSLQERKVKIWDGWRQPYRLDRGTVIAERRPAFPSNSLPPRIKLEAWELPELPEQERALGRAWKEMLIRAASSEGKVSVHPRWLTLSNFLEDAPLLPHAWYQAQKPAEFELDPHWHGAAQYGPTTSPWVHRIEAEQNAQAWSAGEDQLERVAPIPDGELGPVYGAQWRRHVGIRRGQIGADGRAPAIYTDQLAEALRLIQHDPGSRRIIIDAWNVSELVDMALTPCHDHVQFRVSHGRLDCKLTQRSCDILLGVPFNIASYALLTMMMAQVSGLSAGTFIWSGGDVHLYDNHVEQAREQLSREPRALPRMIIDPSIMDIERFERSHFKVEGYDPHPEIRAPVAI